MIDHGYGALCLDKAVKPSCSQNAMDASRSFTGWHNSPKMPQTLFGYFSGLKKSACGILPTVGPAGFSKPSTKVTSETFKPSGDVNIYRLIKSNAPGFIRN